MAAPKRIKVGDKPVLIHDAAGVGGKETKLWVKSHVPLFVGTDDTVSPDNGWRVKEDDKLEWQFPVEHQQLWAVVDGPEVDVEIWAFGPGT